MTRRVHNNGHKRLTDTEIIEMYEKGISPREIADSASLSDRSIRRIVARHGKETRTAGQPRKYQVNEDFFKTWTPEMAYVLGLVVTDGCIYNDAYYKWEIIQNDMPFLMMLNKVIESNYPIIRYETTCRVHRLMINSKVMVHDLIALGVTPRKSLTIKPPPVPDALVRHFIRGVIDGDGWIHKKGYTMNVTTASTEFAKFLFGSFRSLELKSRIYTDTSGKNTVYRVFVSGKNDILVLADWLYTDCGDLYLPRKKKLFYHNDKLDFEVDNLLESGGY